MPPTPLPPLASGAVLLPSIDEVMDAGELLEPLPLTLDGWPRPDVLVMRMGHRGPRLPTGFDTLDKGWRGGALGGKRWGILGAPSAGKTTWALQLAYHFAKQGIPTFYLANDEPREDILIRLGQMHGLNRDQLEAGAEGAKRSLADHLATLPLWVLDPDEDDEADVLAIVLAMREKFPEGSLVLVLDSLQTIAQSIPDKVAEGPRAKVDLVLAWVKTAARKHGVFVVLLSEMNRSAYKYKGESPVEDIAAGKESGGIEYGLDAMCLLRNIPDTNGVVAVTWAKSRLGKVEPFALQKHDATATFTETAMPVKEDGPGPQGTPGGRRRLCTPEKMNEAKKAVLALLRARGELSKGVLLEKLDGKTDINRAAIDLLEDEGVIQHSPGENNSKVYSIKPDSPFDGGWNEGES